MKKIFLVILFLMFFLLKTEVRAQNSQLQQCIQQCASTGSSAYCIENCNNTYRSGSGNLDNVIGTIDKTPGIEEYNTKSGNSIGLVYFISNLLKIASVAIGLWVFINFMLAGFKFITGQGDPGAMGKVINKITLSVIGLALIVLAYTFTAIIGLVLFGKADIFLNPQIPGPTP